MSAPLIALTPRTRHFLRLGLLFVRHRTTVDRFTSDFIWELLDEYLQAKLSLSVHQFAEMGKILTA